MRVIAIHFEKHTSGPSEWCVEVETGWWPWKQRTFWSSRTNNFDRRWRRGPRYSTQQPIRLASRRLSKQLNIACYGVAGSSVSAKDHIMWTVRP